jgi:hypothetical protein
MSHRYCFVVPNSWWLCAAPAPRHFTVFYIHLLAVYVYVFGVGQVCFYERQGIVTALTCTVIKPTFAFVSLSYKSVAGVV